jgi:TPR repeat protein
MNTKSILAPLSLAASLAFAVPANAQDFDAGWAALKAGDYETARDQLEPLSLTGDDRAMLGIAYLYLNGFAVTENYTTAFRLFRDAADLGNADAMYAIATGFYVGEWLEQDFELASEWYKKVEATMEHGNGSGLTTVEGLRQAAEMMTILEAGANRGNVTDQIMLAKRYTDDPLLINLDKSIRWFRAAAEQDDVDAQITLAEMSQLGQGGIPSSVEAHFWFSVAATRNADDAARRRDQVAESLTAETIANNQARLEEWLVRHPR